MNISSGSSDFDQQSREDSSYDHTEKDDVPVLTGKGKVKLQVDEMHEEPDGQISKKIKKSAPIYKSKNATNVVSDPADNNSSSSEKVKSPRSDQPNQVETRTTAITRAEEFRYNLGTKFPTLIKPLVKSHVSGGYWMGIPASFYKSHLPEKNMDITLENETGEQFQMKFVANKLRLNQGWRTFAITQKLVEGDVLIFQLVEFNKFKVYIIKDSNLDEGGGPVGIVNVDARRQQNDTEKDGTRQCHKSLAQNISKRKYSKSPQGSKVRKNKKTELVESVLTILQPANVSKSNDKRTDLEIIASPSSPSSKVQIKNLKSFKEFTIVVNELSIDEELPEHIRAKYYKLCYDTNSDLHACLMQGLNSKLIAGIICEIVSISDSLKQCNLTTCRDEFANWDKALKTFEFLGMDVGFLRTRIQKLVDEFESEGAIEARRYIAAKLRRVRVEEEMRREGSKCIEFVETFKNLDAEVKALKTHAECYEHKFKKIVNAPW